MCVYALINSQFLVAIHELLFESRLIVNDPDKENNHEIEFDTRRNPDIQKEDE